MSNDFSSDKSRKKRNKKRNTKSAIKAVLWAIVLVIFGVCIFLATVKILDPGFDFSSILPQHVISLVGKVQPPQTIEPESTAKPTTETTALSMVNYLDFEEFNFDRSLQGNQIGNLLNGGMVAKDSTYIYHSVDGKGIYRFYGGNETYSRAYKSADKIRCINNRGDFLYFVNASNNKLYKLQKGNTSAIAIAEDVKFAYCYNMNIYYITNDNKLCTMNVKKLSPRVLYNANDNEIEFVGISLHRVFFTEKEYDGTIRYLSIDNKGQEKVREFREATENDEVLSMELENGFFYYYRQRDDAGYDLCRQKFGSEKVVDLIENSNNTDYVEVDSNRLYYTTYKKGIFKMKELNMNSDDKKTLLAVKNVKDDNTLCAYHGGEYDYIIGKKFGDGKKVYYASCVYSSSTNVMQFKNDKWSYI